MRKSIVLTVSLIMLGTLPALAGWDEGVAAFSKRDFKTAESEFQELVNQTPDGWRGHYMLGLSLEQLKRKEEALHHLRKAYDLNPNDLSIKIALGRAYSNVRRYSDVTSLLNTVDSSSLPAKQQAAFYQIRGQAKFKSGDVPGATGDFKKLAELRPSDAQAQYTYATTALQSGQVDASIRGLSKAVKLAPDNIEMTKAYAQVQIRKGRESRDKTAKKTAYLKAAELASKLVSKDASYEHQMLKISAELGAGSYTKAIETGKTATASPSATWLAYYYLGQAYTSAGQFAQAEAPLNTAKSKASSPKDLKNVQRQLGFAYEKQKKYADSIAAYQNAGDQAGVARVSENEKTDRFNKQVEEENDQIKAMEAEAKKLEAELKALEQGGGGV